jgi:hypothetical protein
MSPYMFRPLGHLQRLNSCLLQLSIHVQCVFTRSSTVKIKICICVIDKKFFKNLIITTI